MLVNPKQILQDALKQGYAIPGFSIMNQESAEAMVEEAEDARSPIMLMIGKPYYSTIGADIVYSMVRKIAEAASVPVALHQDHGPSLDDVKLCLDAGFTSVMFDGSHYSFEENIKNTLKAVEYARSYNACIEAELGAVGGAEDNLKDAVELEALMVNPKEAVEFVATTKIDTFAPAIGNVHGISKVEPKLNVALMEEVHRLLPDTPLVLHGASGISDDVIRSLIKAGCAKINVGSEFKRAIRDGHLEYYNTGAYETRVARDYAKKAMKPIARAKFELFGSVGKA